MSPKADPQSVPLTAHPGEPSGTRLLILPGPASLVGRLKEEAGRRGLSTSSLPTEPAEAATLLHALVDSPEPPDVLALWDPSLGTPPWEQIESFRWSLDDAWHPGPRLSGPDEPDLFRYVDPMWVYRPDPAPGMDGAVNWKFDPRALLLRARTVRALGGPEPGSASLAGAVRAMGLRWITLGAICRQRPGLIEIANAPPAGLELADRYRILGSRHGSKWVSYVLIRRLLAGYHPLQELRAWRAARTQSATITATPPPGAALRDTGSVALPSKAWVSVVLPTFGRYPYVSEVLDDLRRQSVPVSQVLIADGNAPGERRPEVYRQFADLPLEVIWIDRPGTCVSRNECLRRATGDYVWFVDDDSRLAEINLEQHLRVLLAYGADVSVGPARTEGRPELHRFQREIACTFMDCGTTLCRREILDQVGGFDMQLNDYLPGEDAELGIRFVQAGGLMLNNPLADRFHYLAPVGGCRTSRNNLHRWRRWSLTPRPARSVYYLARRYYGRAAAREATVLAWLTAGWRRPEVLRDRRSWFLRTLAAEILALPVSLIRLVLSLRAAGRMVREGPSVPGRPNVGYPLVDAPAGSVVIENR